MCSYVTRHVAVDGGAKGGGSWFPVDDVCVYVDHPYFSHAAHTLNIDVRDSAGGPSARVAVELTPESARRLLDSVRDALEEFESVQGPVGA